MPLYRYVAMDPAGRTVQDIQEAENEPALSKALKRNGIFLMEASVINRAAGAAAKPAAAAPAAPARGAAPAPPPAATTPGFFQGSGVQGKEVAVFTNQFSLMIRASLPAAEAMSSLAGTQKNPNFKKVLLDVVERLRRGESMSTSFAKHPEIFDSVYISLLSAGEASGQMPDLLARVSEHMDFQLELKQKLRAAMIYPVIVLVASTSVILFLMIFVMPTFVDIFKQFDAPLPWATRTLLALSMSLRDFWWFHLSAAIAAACGLYWWVRQPENATLIDTAILRFPAIGPMIQAVILTRILRTLAVLVHARVPILKALELTRLAAGNAAYEDLLNRVAGDVVKGKGISSALHASPYFPSTVADMVATAERTGKLPEVLKTSADYYEKEMDNDIENAFAAMEPAFIGILSVVVAAIAISILQPIMSLGGLVQ